MKASNYALLTTLAFSAVAAFPSVAQAAEWTSSRVNQCHINNDVQIQYGLPTTPCGPEGKAEMKGGVMGPVRTMTHESTMNALCRNDNDISIQYGLPTRECKSL